MNNRILTQDKDLMKPADERDVIQSEVQRRVHAKLITRTGLTTVVKHSCCDLYSISVLKISNTPIDLPAEVFLIQRHIRTLIQNDGDKALKMLCYS